MTAGRRGGAALGQVIERWIAHLLAVNVAVEPLVEMHEVPLTWYVGLDAEATRIGDALWKGDLDDASRGRVVAIYRLTFSDTAHVIEKMKGEPVYLLAAMTADKVLRLKPQNLIAGLPVRSAETVS
jgi:hypothetical protein